ncbi:MAG: hypothetical protein H6679_01900 [Epsilonproteobacteria bacterium]|nr:hypothetical protein [Campylobacterota bacterium]
MSASLSSVPTQLFVGSAQQCVQQSMQLLKRSFCTQQKKQSTFARLSGYCSCVQCQMLAAKQHPFVVWLCPERDYRVDDLDVIFARTALMLEPGQHFFFILEQAQQLTPATANRLLKVLEEPPPGYYFFLYTSNEQAVLPTIRSRALVIRLAPDAVVLQHPLLDFFTTPAKRDDAFGFEAVLREHKFSPTQATEFAQLLFEQMSGKLRQAYVNKRALHEGEVAFARQAVEFLQEVLKRPPQPGGADIFLKMLFLTFPR